MTDDCTLTLAEWQKTLAEWQDAVSAWQDKAGKLEAENETLRQKMSGIVLPSEMSFFGRQTQECGQLQTALLQLTQENSALRNVNAHLKRVIQRYVAWSNETGNESDTDEEDIGEYIKANNALRDKLQDANHTADKLRAGLQSEKKTTRAVAGLAGLAGLSIGGSAAYLAARGRKPPNTDTDKAATKRTRRARTRKQRTRE